MTDTLQATLAKAREDFLATVASVRPELHRYCSRLTGSVIEGEDIVQETLAKAFFAMSLDPETPPLRPWLFKIAHNTAVDFLKSHGRNFTESRADMTDVAGFDEAPDPSAVRAALARFVTLPVSQRSSVILKDVLGHSLDETAQTMGTTVMAVKAALVRGRAKLREEASGPVASEARARADLDRYARAFNARDWEAVRSLVSDDCHLDLVSKAHRRGKAVSDYFGRYEREKVALRLVRLEGELALAAYVDGATSPSYFVLLDWEGGRVRSIRDYRYVPYIAREAEFEPIEPLPAP
jgi:RNA polymerase sigma-70 factor (ECF subfamily)